jgi:lambda family phage portal protein
MKPPGKLSVIDRLINFFAPVTGLRRQFARRRLELAAEYRGADTSRLRSNWSLGRSNSTPPSYTLDILRNRSRDLNRNDAVASGATETMAVNIVGRGLRPQSRLRAEILGITGEEARALQRQAEYIWQVWTPLADAGNRLSFDDLQFLALRKIVEDGEVLALPVMAGESWRPISRAVELLESDRLCPQGGKTPTAMDTAVEVGERGQPLAYWISRMDYANQIGSIYDVGNPERVEARDAAGRPRVLHIYRCNRPGQIRGVPYFAPVLTYFKDLSDYLDAELVAAKVAACLAVFVTKTDPQIGALATATGTETNTGKRLQGIEPGLVSYLNLGEDIRVVDPKRGGETFTSFVEGVLRMIGMSLGLPYELLAKDFSKTNYSSARAALLEGRRMFSTWRSWFAAQFCQPFWDLVLEEAYLKGLFKAPRFYEFQSEYSRAAWIGGGWGWIDPVKEVQASKMAIDYGLSTRAEEVASQGRDWEEVFEQLGREQKRAEELGLFFPVSGAPKMAIGASNAPEGETDLAKTE